jgi:hypothetical protein
MGDALVAICPLTAQCSGLFGPIAAECRMLFGVDGVGDQLYEI